MTDSGLVLGFGLPVSGSWATPQLVATLARRADDLGYGSLWTYQRLLSPADGDWGPQYRSVLDPVVALSFAAAVTRRARLGLGVLNAPYLPAAVMAKQLASLDVLSGGRLDAGLGLGWSREEFAAVGAPIERRVAYLEEAVAALRTLWAADPVSFEGEFAQVPPSRFAPKPVQQPHPPLLLGGTAEPALRRAGRIADGWISGSKQDPAEIETAIDTVRSAAQEAGRDAARLRFVVRGVLGLDEDDRDAGGARRPLTGTVDEIREDLDALAARGVTEVFLDLNFVPKVGSPDADPAAAVDHAHRVLETFAPG